MYSFVDILRTHLSIPSSNSTSSVSSSSDSNPSTSASTSSIAGTTFLSSTSNTNTCSVTAVAVTVTTIYKHPSDNSLESTKIKIIKGSKTIIFDITVSTSVILLNTPRISKTDREKLSKRYIFRAQSIEDLP